jgi:sulfate transport system permease protein
LPGFGLSLGYTLFYLSAIVLLPLSALVFQTMHLTWRQFIDTVTSDRVLAAYKVSFGTSLVAAILNSAIGLLVAWVLVRYRFFGKRIVDALIDLPFALPTAVAGIALTTLFSSNGWLGRLLDPLGIHIAYHRAGIVVALVFIGIPFVVRTIQPVLQDLDPEMEEAAASLGANRWIVVRRVVFPELWPAILTGFSLAFARGVGEYGSVIFISANIPMKTEIAPVLIVGHLESGQGDYAQATAIALVMLIASFVMLFLISLFQKWTAGKGVRR